METHVKTYKIINKTCVCKWLENDYKNIALQTIGEMHPLCLSLLLFIFFFKYYLWQQDVGFQHLNPFSKLDTLTGKTCQFFPKIITPHPFPTKGRQNDFQVRIASLRSVSIPIHYQVQIGFNLATVKVRLFYAQQDSCLRFSLYLMGKIITMHPTCYLIFSLLRQKKKLWIKTYTGWQI